MEWVHNPKGSIRKAVRGWLPGFKSGARRMFNRNMGNIPTHDSPRFVLNLRVVKRLVWTGIVLLAFLCAMVPGPHVRGQGVALRSPREGDFLRGTITLTGNSDVPGFSLMSLHFAHQTDGPETWFLLYESQTPVRDGPLATWDTNLVSDGMYQLRIQVTLEDGRVLEDIVPNLTIANDLPEVTPTPRDGTPGPAVESPRVSSTSPPATPLPENPLRVEEAALVRALKTGAGATLTLMILLFLYRRMRTFGK